MSIQIGFVLQFISASNYLFEKAPGTRLVDVIYINIQSTGILMVAVQNTLMHT